MILTEFPEIDEAVHEQLTQFGECRTYQAPDGSTITVLPSAQMPLHCLYDGNWDAQQKGIGQGNFRGVVWIRNLIDGQKVDLYAKGPEYSLLKGGGANGDVAWWGGPRSRDKAVRIFNPIVDEQVDWEATILLFLKQNSIRAEIPQAILRNPKGRKRLVVGGIPGNPSFGNRVLGVGPTIDEIQKNVKAIGLVEEDLTTSNLLQDPEGYSHIIDVNRWEWPPHTDDFRRRLLNLLREVG